MRNFFTKTLYQKRFALLWWFIGITAVTWLTASFYHSFQSTDIEQLYKSLPPAVRQIAGDAASLKTIDGYLRQQIFALRVPLLVIILSISMLVGLTAGDEQKGLLETHLAMPVSRTSLLLQKVSAAFVIIALASLGGLMGIIIAMAFLGESFNPVHILQYTVNCLAVSLVYGVFAMAIAAATGRRGLALGIGSGFAFLSYLINSMAPSVSFLATVDKLTFFHYYKNDPVSLRNFLVLVLAIVILLALGIIGFKRRDVRAN